VAVVVQSYPGRRVFRLMSVLSHRSLASPFSFLLTLIGDRVPSRRLTTSGRVVV
jgi:hypothetical protein